MIRTLRYLGCFVVYMGYWGSRVLLAASVGVKQRTGGIYDRAARGWARGMLRGARITVRVEGRERLDPSVPKVYIANHASQIDIWAILAEFPGTIRFVYKKGMDWIPLMGMAMRAARHIPIKRQIKSAAFAAYDEAASYIRAGSSAVVFAEGTRSRNGKLQPFKKGPFVLAIAAQAPVLPVFCEGTFELMPKGSWSPKPGSVTLRLGEPIPTTGMSYEDRARLADETRAALVAMGARE
ncbi:MAG TPA: lysophospholipid acyltransferase family protein [Gemmatimonadales bacterium]|jgi:1-acyl-sn-glycerol-3-phosphate acyltransferase|nr:lysophospholipid acyltransferase family protein [Gemmatimonadales bacterium]